MILNTGIDPDDKLIKRAWKSRQLGRCQGFVYSAEGFVHMHGHGTLTTKLLLQYAPLAEIHVAKIADSDEVDYRGLSCIPEVFETPIPSQKSRLIRLSYLGYQMGSKRDKRSHDCHSVSPSKGRGVRGNRYSYKSGGRGWCHHLCPCLQRPSPQSVCLSS